jgi:hypothetical protein
MGLSNAYGIGSLRPGVCTSTTRPASPFVGQTIYETDTKTNFVWNGSSWTPSGITVCTSSTRPTSPVEGQTIYETDTRRHKTWLGSAWSVGYLHEQNITMEYLVQAGGGGGQRYSGGGGGGGQIQSGEAGAPTFTPLPGSYTIVVGAGSVSKGSASSIGSVVATEGGGHSVTNAAGVSGGCGGGRQYNYAPPGSGNAGPPRQGYDGGYGGGGTGAAATLSTNNGGAGRSTTIRGTTEYFGGGGGGCGYATGVGGTAGGIGGGGSYNTPGTANTGGGGGASLNDPPYSNAGGSGIVILRYVTAEAAGLTITGGTVTYSGSHTIHTFTSTGSLVIS